MRHFLVHSKSGPLFVGQLLGGSDDSGGGGDSNHPGTGENSIQLGLDASATGAYSTAVGPWCYATADGAMAWGYGSVANDERCVSLGAWNEAYNGGGFGADQAVAVGAYNNATASGATSVGNHNNSTGEGSVTLGSHATASAEAAVAIGSFSYAHGAGSVSVRGNVNAGADNSAAILGVCSSEQQVAIGPSSVCDSNSKWAMAFGSASFASGEKSLAVGYSVRALTAGVAEIGVWKNDFYEEEGIPPSEDRHRLGSVRMHSTGMVALTVQDRSTAYDASSVPAIGRGAEADNELAVGMFAIRRDGDAVYIDLNIEGTVKTLSLGTAS